MRIPLELAPGLVRDDTSFAASGRYEDGSNVRFHRRRPQTIGGWSALTSDMLTGKCRAVMPWTDNSDILNIAFGTNSKLYVYQGGTLYDITSSGLAAGSEDGVGGPGYGADTFGTGTYGTPRTNYFPRTWTFANYGQSLIACPRHGTIYQWSNNTASLATAVANAPAKVNCILVTPERQLVAFGCNEETSGSFNPLCIRWSDIENITDWTTGSADNAGEQILEGGGRIVAARLFGNGIAVWTDNAVHFMTFVGEPGQTFQVDRIEENCGLIGPNAVAIIDQVAYWLAPDKQFRIWPLGGTPEILPCPIRKDFADNIAEAQGDKIVAAPIARFSEVWFHYPDARDGNENSRYIAFCLGESREAGVPVWFRGALGRSAACDAGVAGYPLMVSPAGSIFYHEYGATANGGALSAYIETSYQYIEEAGRNLMIKAIYPDFEGQQGAVSMTLYTAPYPQGDVTMHTAVTLAVGADKADFRASGSVAKLRFTLSSNPGYVRLGKPVFDVAVRGKR